MLYVLLMGYLFDGECGIKDLVLMYGEFFGVDMYVVIVECLVFKNFELVVNCVYLFVEGMIVIFYVSGFVVLVDDEVEFGCVVIDMGGGMMMILVFVEGWFVYIDVVNFGGYYVMMDFVCGFLICIEDVEWLKIVYGLVIVMMMDECEIIFVLLMDGDIES